jgi:hypothetical protein
MISRTPRPHATGVDARPQRIESLAAEFALLAQRRARLVQQMDLLDRQRETAAAGFNKLQARMAWLARKIDALDPELREEHGKAVVAPPPAPTPQPVAHTPAHAGKLTPGAISRAPNGGRMAPMSRVIGATKTWRT